MDNPCKPASPVVFIFFNRPQLTAQVFGAIRNAQPEKLFLISDGARPTMPEDSERVATCREIVAKIDWPCQVFRNFSEENLGCKRRVISGLDWVFSQVDRAIILEDDCLPNPDFFRFTDELLEYYALDARVGVISGTNPLPITSPGENSYFFSKRPWIWGWATWSRVWKNYDGEISDWPAQRKSNLLRENLHTSRAIRYWNNALDGVHKNVIDTWDIQLGYYFFKTGQLSATPSRNLVSNIGFGVDATHTLDSKNSLSQLATFALDAPLLHPTSVEVWGSNDRELDSRYAPPVWRLWISELARRLPPRLYSWLRILYNRLP